MVLVRVRFAPNLTGDFPSNDSGLRSENGMWLPCHFYFDVTFICFGSCTKISFQSIL